MENLVKNFFAGNISLWKAYWLVGEILNALFIFIVFNIEIKIFNNNVIGNILPFINFNNFNFLSKILLILWTLSITIGIWKSAENYKGPFTWILLTLIFLSYRLFSLRVMFL